MSISIPSFGEIVAVAQSQGALNEWPELWNGLIECWPMQEGGGSTTFGMVSRKDGTLTSMAPASDWVMSEKGWGLNMIENQQITTAPLGISGEPMTVSGWFNCASCTAGAYFLNVMNWFGGGSGLDWSLKWWSGDNGIRFDKYCSGDDFGDTWYSSYTLGDWTHFALTYDGGILGSGVEWWTNGISRGVGSSVGTGTPDTSTAAFVIGAHSIARDVTVGSIAVHDHVLSSRKIVTLSTDPYALFRPRRRYYAAVSAPGVSIPVIQHHRQQQGVAA